MSLVSFVSFVSFVRSFIRSFVRSFIRSFVRSFIRPFVPLPQSPQARLVHGGIPIGLRIAAGFSAAAAVRAYAWQYKGDDSDSGGLLLSMDDSATANKKIIDGAIKKIEDLRVK